MSDDDEFNARDLILILRGGIPANCDFCNTPTTPENLHPEEGGEWVCTDCLTRWEKEDEREGGL